ncbi:DUF1616 domain-containing protein (plasmid) [Halobaculum sp. CBA1158]|uniref:DUF1616 domain-containing protein n=1 Tax=Halobaculum sp. CBA1158 TaxID=2904243 RepID=UPI001F3599CB|nr:DUF1616 domain-containing protein [Halobaculum sp. CBA1158]UIP01538.1 DUF1616 domain-containing protein [Halobaculum sp. CBA1158]
MRRDPAGDGDGAIRSLPIDTPILIGYAIVAGAVIALGVVDGPLRVLLATPLVGVLPGYALLSVLFPGDRPADADRPTPWRLPLTDGLGWSERCSLSVVASLVLLPLIVVGLAVVGAPLATPSITATLVGVVVAGAVAGAVRRLRLPASSRYDLPSTRGTGTFGRPFGEGDGPNRADRVLSGAVAVAALLAVGGLAVGLAAPVDGESYTEAAVLTPGADGPVAGDYPASLSAGESTDLVVAVENRLGEAADYEVVLVLDRVEVDDSGETMTVLERSELTRFDLSLADGERTERDVSIAPDLIGEDLRLSVFVHRGEAPSSPSAETATEHLYLWVDVA